MRLGPEALTRAVVRYRCPKWKVSEPHRHTHTEPAPEVVTFSDNFRVMSIQGETECPTCWKEIGAFGPPFAHVVGIEWEPPG